MVVDGLPEPLPALGVAPVAVDAGPEVADPAAGVAERVVHPGPVEHPGDPLPVVGGIVTDEDRPARAEVPVQPGGEVLRYLPVGGDPRADERDGRVSRVWCSLEQPPVEGVTAVVVHSPELGQDAVDRTSTARLAVNEYPGAYLGCHGPVSSFSGP